MSFKDIFILNLKHLEGRRSKRKLLAIECDDWGSIRMPSRVVFQKMIRQNLPIPNNRFNHNDTLADKQDLEQLFDVLLSVKDKNGHAAVMTPVTNVANPDFDKIRESDFTQYYYEPFTETLARYGRDTETFSTWKRGIDLGIFIPVLHGREHVSVQLWLKNLRAGDRNLRIAFDNEFLSIDVDGLSPAAREFRPEFYFTEDGHIGFLETSIVEGVKLFKDIFGFLPLSFVPSNGVFHPIFEPKVVQSGVKFLNVNHFCFVPQKDGNLKPRYYRDGGRSSAGLTYYARNCAFEPCDQGYKGIDKTLRQIEIAYRWRKPVIISSHRVNFVGGIERGNRESGLKELKLLLDAIIRKWPDTEFISSAGLLCKLFPESY